MTQPPWKPPVEIVQISELQLFTASTLAQLTAQSRRTVTRHLADPECPLDYDVQLGDSDKQNRISVSAVRSYIDWGRRKHAGGAA